MKTIDDIADVLGRDDPVVKKMMMRLEHGICGVQVAEKNFGKLLKRRKRMSFHDIASYLPPNHDLVCAGDIFFAKDWETGEKRISLNPTFSNIAVFGSPGKGKTEAFKRLAYEFMDHGNTQVKVIDFLNNFTGLSGYSRNCVSMDTPSINILVNEGVAIQRWINEICDSIAFHSDTMMGGRSFLNRMIIELSRMFKGSGQMLTLPDLSEYMAWLIKERKLNQADMGYCQRIVGKLKSWDAESSGAFSCQRGILESLDYSNLIISLPGLSDEMQRFYVSAIITRDFIKRLFNPGLCENPLVVMVDECKHIFSRKDERPGVDSHILSILTQTRNVNMYWIVATQEPSQMAHTCIANSGSKIVFGLSEGYDLGVVKQSMMLNANQMHRIERFTTPGEAVIKLAGYPEPFLARVEMFEVPPYGLENVARENQALKEKASESVITRSGFLEKTLFARERAKEGKYGKMSGSARRLLEAYGREPYKSLTDLYKAAGLGTKGSKAKKELSKTGFIEERDINVRTRKGSGKYLLNITERGRSWLKDSGIKSAIRAKGGPKELYYSVAIEEWSAVRGFSVHREFKGSDLVLISKEKESIAVEIACRKENQVNNIKRDLEAKLFKKIVMACESEKIMNDVEQEYLSSGIDPEGCEVAFLIVTELML